MKRKKDYRLKIKSDKQKGKFPCPECERKFHTPFARTAHGVVKHHWRAQP